MTLRSDIAAHLTDAGWTVVPWGHTAPGQYLIVRPGGMIDGRLIMDIWIVNPAAHQTRDTEGRIDPDHGLDQASLDVHDLLRTKLMALSITPGPDYNPTGGTGHHTMICTGTSPTTHRRLRAAA